LVASFLSVVAARVEAGTTVFAQGNFFIHKGQLSAVNYRSGTMLPVGAKVEVIKVKDDEVKCRAVEGGAEFEFVSHKSLGKNAKNIFSSFFTEVDPAPRLAALPADVQKRVRASELQVGMSKEAVLLTVGPPPPHKTASLESSRWMYWRTKLATFEVVFDEAGKVVSFGEPVEAPKESKGLSLSGLFKKDEQSTEVLFARSNLHHAEGVVSWVNYQAGPIIPFNSKIEVVDKGSSSVKFKVVGGDQKYTFENDSRSGKDVWSMFLEVFAKEDQAEKLGKLTEKERKKVAGAEVEPGMSREAVRMAWGPPPPHQTPAFESATWTYWRSKVAKVQLAFGSDDKLQTIR
jgi:outer membrane protein assembly factor BamE (lipoprotein component of BamABCDE complex)